MQYVQLCHLFLNLFLPLCFTGYALGLCVAFCGPLRNPYTEYCRALFLAHPHTRLSELWLFYGIGLMYFAVTLQTFLMGWFVVAFFAFCLGLTELLRGYLLRKFPERGTIRQNPYELIRVDGMLKITRR